MDFPGRRYATPDIRRRASKRVVFVLTQWLHLGIAVLGIALVGTRDRSIGSCDWPQISAATSTSTPSSTPTASPDLSLETLYHPTTKFDFDGDLPATHWIDGEPA